MQWSRIHILYIQDRSYKGRGCYTATEQILWTVTTHELILMITIGSHKDIYRVDFYSPALRFVS